MMLTVIVHFPNSFQSFSSTFLGDKSIKFIAQALLSYDSKIGFRPQENTRSRKWRREAVILSAPFFTVLLVVFHTLFLFYDVRLSKCYDISSLCPLHIGARVLHCCQSTGALATFIYPFNRYLQNNSALIKLFSINDCTHKTW